MIQYLLYYYLIWAKYTIINNISLTFVRRNKDALQKFMILLKNVYPKSIEEFQKLMSAMDYMSSYPPVLTNIYYKIRQ